MRHPMLVCAGLLATLATAFADDKASADQKAAIRDVPPSLAAQQPPAPEDDKMTAARAREMPPSRAATPGPQRGIR